MNRSRRRLFRRAATVALASAVLSSACTEQRDPLEIGLRRVALDLAFRDAEKALPVEPRQVITQIIPAELTGSVRQVVIGGNDDEEPVEATTPRRVVRVPPPPPSRVPPCAAAPEGATPRRQAFVVIKDPPKVGTYVRRNVGEIGIKLPTSDFTLPYPPSTVWDLPRVEARNAPVAVNDGSAPVGLPKEAAANTTVAPPNFEFDVVRNSLPGYSVTDTYFYTYTSATGGDYLYLKKRVTVADGAVSEFNPTPPIRVVRLGVSPGGDGTTSSESNHGGTDRETNVAMTIQSDVVGREEVDVCGELLDTYVVRFQERVVDLSKSPPDVSGNDPEKFNFWNIQFDNGLLIVRETVDTVNRTSVKVPGTPAPIPIEIRAKYTSTLRSPSPSPLGTKAPRVVLEESESSPSPSDDAEEDS